MNQRIVGEQLVTWARAAARVARGALSIALCGYAVLAIFGVAYWVVGVESELSTVQRATVASLLAAPVALGLLWPYLTGFKAFGFEVTLSQVAVTIDTTLALAVSSAPSTDSPSEIMEEIKRAIARPETELVEVDLRDGHYWYSTRLFLLAALADDFSAIQRLVFVENGVKRTFVGFASPAAVRKALDAVALELEGVYRELVTNPPYHPSGDPVASIVSGWSSRRFGSPPIEEKTFASRVSSSDLHNALIRVRRPLETTSVEWSGIPDPPLVRAIVRDFNTPYVALLRGGARDRVVNRIELATRIAADAVKR